MFDTVLSIDLQSPLLFFAHPIVMVLTVDKLAASFGGMGAPRYKKSLGLGLGWG